VSSFAVYEQKYATKIVLYTLLIQEEASRLRRHNAYCLLSCTANHGPVFLLLFGSGVGLDNNNKDNKLPTTTAETSVVGSAHDRRDSD
jgi:hypothetical protein